jgi:dCMP deaminase
MQMAQVVATRGTCDRKQVGVVIISDDKHLLATGYNGSLPGQDHCDEGGHDMVEGHCVRTMHAEANAVAHAARRGVSLEGATAFITTFPCWPCAKLLISAGVVEIVYAETYRPDERVAQACALSGVTLRGP